MNNPIIAHDIILVRNTVYCIILDHSHKSFAFEL